MRNGIHGMYHTFDWYAPRQVLCSCLVEHPWRTKCVAHHVVVLEVPNQVRQTHGGECGAHAMPRDHDPSLRVLPTKRSNGRANFALHCKVACEVPTVNHLVWAAKQ